MPTTVKQLLRFKGHDVWSVGPDATVYEALEVMADKDIGAVVVIAEDGSLVGILSERDYARKVILKGRMSRDTRVREIMVSHVVTVRPEQTVEECMVLMTEKNIKHLPVLKGHKLVGLISIGDVVKWIIREQAFTIEKLEGYVTGRIS